ncbi:efflux RND transporter periplasmic adaptor subunit [Rhodocytophaga rosea]|uniref:Efflux RND transporter periplasmic adaptor subunit n=1 Tax=Rhodocytophaga rosea TaxID=2704465 RepID=A0A6C0GV80_9BACT|nr:efflux RND transporter periplasmic adaptor subunit [Rhodocytophaga rosea]QHT71260.1 efflux RND transporter periplasmic adaptor subunit [Rhodocytophaga rosea]
MKLKYFVYAILLIGLSSLVGYRIVKNKSQANTPGGAGGGRGGAGGGGAAMRVNGVVVKSERFANALLISGTIDANEQVFLRSQVSGIITALYFKEGSIVKQGQALLQIDNTELNAQLSEIGTREKLASENEQRAVQLLDKGAISQQEYDIALADLKSLRAQKQLISAQLAKTTVRAPFTGTIGLRSISVGEYLSPQTVVAKLVNTNPLKITFSVPEKYATQVKVNTKVTFTISGSTKKYTATVYAIEPSIDALTRTLQLRAWAENPEGELRPGAFANIELPLTILDDAILIPTEAVVPVQNGKKVFVAENGKAKEVKVETSTRREQDILITSGLKAGDTVLTTGVMSLKPQMPVKVVIPKTGSN